MFGRTHLLIPTLLFLLFTSVFPHNVRSFGSTDGPHQSGPRKTNLARKKPVAKRSCSSNGNTPFQTPRGGGGGGGDLFFDFSLESVQALKQQDEEGDVFDRQTTDFSGQAPTTVAGPNSQPTPATTVPTPPEPPSYDLVQLPKHPFTRTRLPYSYNGQEKPPVYQAIDRNPMFGSQPPQFPLSPIDPKYVMGLSVDPPDSFIKPDESMDGAQASPIGQHLDNKISNGNFLIPMPQLSQPKFRFYFFREPIPWYSPVIMLTAGKYRNSNWKDHDVVCDLCPDEPRSIMQDINLAPQDYLLSFDWAPGQRAPADSSSMLVKISGQIIVEVISKPNDYKVRRFRTVIRAIEQGSYTLSFHSSKTCIVAAGIAITNIKLMSLDVLPQKIYTEAKKYRRMVAHPTRIQSSISAPTKQQLLSSRSGNSGSHHPRDQPPDNRNRGHRHSHESRGNNHHHQRGRGGGGHTREIRSVDVHGGGGRTVSESQSQPIPSRSGGGRHGGAANPSHHNGGNSQGRESGPQMQSYSRDGRDRHRPGNGHGNGHGRSQSADVLRSGRPRPRRC